MSQEINNCRISLSSSTRMVSEITCTLEISNISTLVHEEDFTVDSPVFEFADAKWCLLVKKAHDSDDECDSDDESESGNECDIKDNIDVDYKSYLDITIVRLHSTVPFHKLLCYIDVLNDKGDIYDKKSGLDIVFTGIQNRWSFSWLSYPIINLKSSNSVILGCKLMCSKTTGGDAESQTISSTRNIDVETLCQNLKDMLLHGEGYDLTLKVKDREFRAHQYILKARSEVFNSMLTHDMLEKNNGIIEVVDCEPQAIEQLLLYVYSGEIETLNENNMLGLYYAADKYNMKNVKEECRTFIKNSLNVTYICRVVQLALNHSDGGLLEYATDYFVNNIKDILPTLEWMIFLKENTIAANELLIKTHPRN